MCSRHARCSDDVGVEQRSRVCRLWGTIRALNVHRWLEADGAGCMRDWARLVREMGSQSTPAMVGG